MLQIRYVLHNGEVHLSPPLTSSERVEQLHQALLQHPDVRSAEILPAKAPVAKEHRSKVERVLSVREVVTLYLAYLEKRKQAGTFDDDNYANSRHELNRFTARYGSILTTQCRKRDLTEWLEANPQWKSAWTQKRIITTIVRPFLWAAEEGLIHASPYRAPKNMRSGKPRRPIKDAEYVLLMRACPRQLRRAFFFLRRTGARTCEMRNLRWTEIDFDRGVIVIEYHKTFRQQKDARPRIIGLDPATLRFLRNLYRRRRPGQGYVFVNTEGTPWDRNTFARQMNRWAEKLGLDPTRTKLSAYCFRHAYGTAAIEAGIGERQLADQMGHTTTRMVSYYAQTAGKIEHLKRVAEEALRKRRREK